jgi:hypothetical protein
VTDSPGAQVMDVKDSQAIRALQMRDGKVPDEAFAAAGMTALQIRELSAEVAAATLVKVCSLYAEHLVHAIPVIEAYPQARQKSPCF